jgi:hypothetical protein
MASLARQKRSVEARALRWVNVDAVDYNYFHFENLYSEILQKKRGIKKTQKIIISRVDSGR